MSVTIEQIARKAKTELDSDINLQIVGEFVTDRITELYAKTKYKTLRKLGELYLPAALGGITNPQGTPNPNGTVTVTVGSNVVLGDSLAASFWNNTLAGQFFRVFQFKTWYRIAKCDPPNLYLVNPLVSENNAQFAPPTPVAQTSYYITPRYFPAALDARYFGVFALDYLYQPVEFLSADSMQRRYPSRFLVGPYPWVISEFGSDLTQTGQPKLLEPYPSPNVATIMHYVYYSVPPVIDFYSEIPSTLDEHIPRELCMIPMMRYEMAKAARAGQVEQAAFWRNEFRTQQTVAERLIDQAIQNDSGVDDQTFMIQTSRSRRRSADYDPIQTSREDVWSRNG